jgi:hypothetical protein
MKRSAFIIILAITIIQLLNLSCSNPLGPKESGWVLLYTLDTDIQVIDFYVSPACTFFIIGNDRFGKNAVYKLDGSDFVKEFELDYTDYSLSDLGFRGDNIWAVGRKKVGGEYKPLLVHYDGERWKEINVNYPGMVAVNYIYVVNYNVFWFLCMLLEEPGSLKLFYYDSGLLRYFPQKGRIGTTAYSDKGIFYLFLDLGLLPEEDRYRLAISDNSGETWALEEIELNSGSCYSIKPSGSPLCYAVSGALFINLEIHYGETRYEGIIKRTGKPGEGVYEIVFYSPLGPYFRDIYSMSFKDGNNGIFIGLETTVVLENGKWFLEEYVPENYFKIGHILADYKSGYYVLTGTPGEYSIIYHP